ncbi:hypothetical protein [Acaryochloris marina]|nr:hypothetical protein [Acaryochloris marina]
MNPSQTSNLATEKKPQGMRLRDRLILFGLQEGYYDVSSLTAFYNLNRPSMTAQYGEQIPGERYCYRITELGIIWCQIWRSKPLIPIPRTYT